MTYVALSNAAYRVSLRDPGAELEGDVQTPPPGPARLVPAAGVCQTHAW